MPTRASARTAPAHPERSKRARSSDDFWNLAASEPLSSQELAQAMDEYRRTRSPESCSRVMQSHMRLVAKIAWRHCRPSVQLDDLMAEGALALRKAMNTYDPSRQTSFTAYASVVIDFAVRDAARTHHDSFRMPGRERRRAAARGRIEAEYFAEHGHKPGVQEAAPDSGTTAAPSAPDALGRLLVPLPGSVTSLYGADDRGGGLVSSLADAHPSPLEWATSRDELHRLKRAVQHLATPACDAVRLRFGLGGQSPHAVADIARVLNVPPATVEQLLQAGLRQLRATMAAHPRSAGEHRLTREA